MFYEKLKNSIKRKSKILLNMLMSNRQTPKFSVSECKNPIFFAYFIHGDIFFISNRPNVEFSEVIIDEVIKVGVENNEFVFYPAREDSAFFKDKYEIDTFNFIELIIANNLNEVASEIHSAIEAFRRRILDYAIFYQQKLENAICSIDFSDRCGILALDLNIKWEIENALKAQITQIAKENIIDSNANIFEILFGAGIYEVENVAENAISESQIMSSKLLNYYNRSNLANNVENELCVALNVGDSGDFNQNAPKMRFFIRYFIDSILLKTNENGKIFANAHIVIKTLSMQGSPKFCYLNNDLKITFIGDNIIIYNLQKIPFILHSIKSKWIISSDESTFESTQNLTIKDKKLIKNTAILENLHLHLDDKISHKLELLYSTQSDEKRFFGSGSVRFADIFSL